MRIRDVEHEGLAAIEVVHERARLVIVHAVGPRIAWFGRVDGDNLLFWDADATLGRGAWRIRGGHRVWVTRPLADETEESYAADEEPCRVRRAATTVRVTAPPDAFGLEKSIAVRPAWHGFAIESSVRNASDMLWSGGVWTLTATRPTRGTTYRVPLGDDTAWDVVAILVPRRWGGGHTARLADPQVRIEEDALVLVPGGVETKRMLRAPQGTIEMRSARGGLMKVAPYVRGATYPEGCNLALYLAPGNAFVEIEAMGPQRVLGPDERLSLLETWTLG